MPGHPQLTKIHSHTHTRTAEQSWSQRQLLLSLLRRATHTKCRTLWSAATGIRDEKARTRSLTLNLTPMLRLMWPFVVVVVFFLFSWMHSGLQWLLVLFAALAAKPFNEPDDLFLAFAGSATANPEKRQRRRLNRQLPFSLSLSLPLSPPFRSWAASVIRRAAGFSHSVDLDYDYVIHVCVCVCVQSVSFLITFNLPFVLVTKPLAKPLQPLRPATVC